MLIPASMVLDKIKIIMKFLRCLTSKTKLKAEIKPAIGAFILSL
jgi:hypothetical protein